MLKEAKIFLKVLIYFIVIIKKENCVANYIGGGVYVADSQSAMKCIYYRLDWVGGIVTYKIIIK